MTDTDHEFDSGKFQKDVQIRIGFENWKRQQKREELLARGENPDDFSLDDIGNTDDGVNTRNGFPQYKPVMNHNKNMLSKPKSVTV